MTKTKFVKTLILSVCLTVGFSGVVYASTSEARLVMPQTDVGSPDTAVSSFTLLSPSEDILQKQREVDQYVFEQHKDEIAAKGFKVTHTGPLDNSVEIGIEPYSEDNAEYLYSIFGKDKVKVVEGQQAYTLGLASADNGDAAEVLASANVASSDKSQAEAGTTSTIPWVVYALGVVIVFGVAAVALKRILPIGKK